MNVVKKKIPTNYKSIETTANKEQRRSKKERGTKTNSKSYDIDDVDPSETIDIMDISDENQIVSGRRESLAWR